MKRLNNLHLLLLFLVAIIIMACTPSVPRKYIQPDDLEDLLYDYHLSRSMAEHTTTNHEIEYNRRLYFNATLKKHGVTQAEFDSSMIYYYSHADRLAKIYRKVADRMEESANEMGASAISSGALTNYSTSGDTANIWRNSTHIFLTPNPPYNRMDFEIDVDTAFRHGDKFEFNMRADYINQSGTKEAIAYIAVKYENDSVVAYTKPMPNSGKIQLKITSNSKLDIKKMWGFLYMGRGKDESANLKLLFLSDIQLVRFRKEKKSEVNYSAPKDQPKDSLKRQKATLSVDDSLSVPSIPVDVIPDTIPTNPDKTDTVSGPRQVKPRLPSLAQPRKKTLKTKDS